MSRVALGVLCLALGACTTQDKAAAVQAGLNAGMQACDMLAADPSIPRLPEVDEFCLQMTRGCR